ncbi:F-box family protein [Tasmannia lanceolata]|uniref:F-box family protein n=1 Tax=Tasmannia lanceolata TaxID=3420 RepID=UPI004064C52F
MEVFSTTTMSSTSRTSPWMDSRIWSKLPHRLVDRVLSFLPPPSFFLARSVCKRWYSLLFSDSFLEMHLHLSTNLHWFIFFKNKKTSTNTHHYIKHQNPSLQTLQGFILDPHENTWYKISFTLIPTGFSPVASSGGLLCFSSDDAGPKYLILYNPLSKSLTQLPPTSNPRLCPTIGLTVSHTALSVVIAGDDLISPFAVKNLTTESFHVDGGGFYSLWNTTCPLPRLCSFESGRMVFVDGKFYSMNYSPFSILSYELSSNEWCKIQAPMRRFLRSPSLIECRGRLVLVAAVEKSKLNVPKSVRMWGLQGCGRTWVEIERMPPAVYVQFTEAESGRGFECIGNGDFIVITIRGSDDLLLFDFYRKVWNWVARCPFLGEDGGFFNGFAFEPRLATPAIGLLDPSSFSFQGFNGE